MSFEPFFLVLSFRELPLGVTKTQNEIIFAPFTPNVVPRSLLTPNEQSMLQTKMADRSV